MEIVKNLFALSIPLNFIGFFIKYKTKIPNYLIAIFLTLISLLVSGVYAKYCVSPEPKFIIKFSILHGIIITSLATYNWDSAFGIKSFISEIMGVYKKTQLKLEASMKERIKEYRKGLIKRATTVFFTDLLMVIICISIKASIPETIDYFVYTTLIALGTVLIEDLTNKAFTEKEKLNMQYFIVFILAFCSLGALSAAYFSKDWTVFTVSLVTSVIFIALTFFLAHFSYIPSLRTKEEVMQDVMDKKWAFYEKQNLEQDEVIEDMLKSIKYYFKKDLWGADLDFANPLFLDDKGNPQTAKGASFARGNNTPIENILPYFKKIVETKEQVLADKKKR